MTTDEIRTRAQRAHADARDEIPLAFLVGHMPDADAFEALRALRRAGEIEMVEPGFWRLTRGTG